MTGLSSLRGGCHQWPNMGHPITWSQKPLPKSLRVLDPRVNILQRLVFSQRLKVACVPYQSGWVWDLAVVPDSSLLLMQTLRGSGKAPSTHAGDLEWIPTCYLSSDLTQPSPAQPSPCGHLGSQTAHKSSISASLKKNQRNKLKIGNL